MKLSNLFKKSAKAAATSNVQKLEKSQLEKVIGGGGPNTGIDGEIAGQKVKTKSNHAND